jgi:ssDNA-binding Zn-finger/Zn-ribbon topoisomerase 1
MSKMKDLLIRVYEQTAQCADSDGRGPCMSCISEKLQPLVRHQVVSAINEMCHEAGHKEFTGETPDGRYDTMAILCEDCENLIERLRGVLS